MYTSTAQLPSISNSGWPLMILISKFKVHFAWQESDYIHKSNPVSRKDCELLVIWKLNFG